MKDQRFVKLQGLVKDENITVIRGKYNATHRVSVWSLVVGDVVLLETGQRVPADCIIISAVDLRVDEEPEDDNVQQKAKAAREDDGDPFLKCDSLVVRGTCKALVAAVGQYSSRGKYATSISEQLNKVTALQTKLKNLSGQFNIFAILSAFLVLIILITMTVIESVYAGNSAKFDADGAEIPNKKSVADVIFSKLPQHINLVVVLIVVAVPEGLPMTVGISLAFSVMRMFKERILVRKLESPEQLGGCDEIVCGKTACITQNDMKVNFFILEGNKIKNSRKDTFLNCELAPDTIELVKNSILYNCSAQIEMEGTQYVPHGNGTEVGLLKFLQDADVPVHTLIQQKLGHVKATIPFSSDNKLSACAVEQQGRDGQVSVAIYIKGAPEEIFRLCQQTLTEGGIVDMNGPAQNDNQLQQTIAEDLEH